MDAVRRAVDTEQEGGQAPTCCDALIWIKTMDPSRPDGIRITDLIVAHSDVDPQG